MSNQIDWRVGLSLLPKYWLMNEMPSAEMPEFILDLEAEFVLSTERPAAIFMSFECLDDWEQDELMEWIISHKFKGYGFTMSKDAFQVPHTVAVLFAFLEEPSNIADNKLNARALEVAKWYAQFNFESDNLED